MTASPTREPPLIALLFPPTVGYFADVATGIQRVAETRGWLLEMCPTFDVAMGVATQQKRPDGVLIHSGEWDSPALLRHTRGIPTVQVGGTEIPGLPRVTTDNTAIGVMAAEHFLDRGFTRFAFCGYANEDWSRDRHGGFTNTLKKSGYACKSVLTAPGHVCAAAVPAEMATWAATLLPGPVAVFACHDRAARLLAHACAIAGLRIPDDIAILGVDNNAHECALRSPQLSSVMGSAHRVGHDGASLLADLIDGQSPPQSALLVPPAGVAVRQSTDLLAVEDADIATALRFIREHAADNIDVDAVVAATKISRRLLEKKFAAILARSPRQEILKAHLREAKSHLQNTPLSAAEIATLCGFPSPSKFAAVFRRETGLSPTEFRRLYGVN